MIKFLKWLLALMEKPETPQSAIPGLMLNKQQEIEQCPFCKFDGVSCIDMSCQGGKGFAIFCLQCGLIISGNPDWSSAEMIKRYNSRPVENQLRRDMELLLKD